MLLKHYLDQGVSKAALSRWFGVNRRTIHYWIETGQLDRELSAGARGYAPRPPVAHKLDLLTPASEAERTPMIPLHELCLFKLGIPLSELWYLGELAEWLGAHGRNRFFLTAPPLRLPKAAGSPVTPIATV